MTTIYQSKTEVNPITTTKAHATVSNKYHHVNTEEIIRVFESAGLRVAGQSFAKPRKEHRAGFQKHLVIFETDYLIGNDRMQLLLTNSHDGRSSFGIDIGVFRAVCANGLVAGSTFGSERVRHQGDVLPRIDIAIKKQLERLPMVASAVDGMINTNEYDVISLLSKALQIRIPENKRNDCIFIGNLDAQRVGDNDSNLWTAFNILQERLIRGGFYYQDTEGDLKKTRKITSVSRQMDVNRKLWNVAESLIEVA